VSSIPPVQPEVQDTQMQQAQAAPNPYVEDATQPLGDNFENLSKRLQIAMWNLLMEQEREDEIPRRNEVLEILQRKLYFRGEQYWWYSDSQGQWFPPTVAPANAPENWSSPEFQYATNIIRAFAESLQSVLSQDNTSARFWPETPSDPNDIETAKQASKAVDLIHRKNDWQNLIDSATYYMNTDGFLGGYVRHVTDAERYGSDEMDVYGESQVEVAPATVECPCGFQQEGTTDTQPVCPNCGEATQDVPPVMATVPQHLGTIQIPKGQTCISIVPALNLKRTMWADNQSDFLYLEWIFDQHKAKAMSLYPSKAQKIMFSAGSYGDGGTANSYERIARRLLYLGTGRHTGMVLKDLGIVRRAWLRPCLFEALTDDFVKTAFKTLYPKGAYVVFYNDVYCESKSECMDECWETMQTCDGEGQVRPTLISSIMPIQDQLNDSVNLLFEQNMNGVPEVFGDQNTIDFEARDAQIAAPGNMTPIDLPAGQDIRQKVLFSTAVEPSVALQKYMTDLMGPIAQFLTGVFPALFGGDTGSNDTASGIAIQRNQALGRIGRAWRRLQLFCCNLDGKAINCFQKNMTEDIELPKENESGDYESDYIRIEDMQGKVVAYPEVEAQYPTLQSDVRGLILSLLNEGNPLFLATAQQAENMEYIYREIGLSDLEIPGEEQRRYTTKVIQQLLQGQPTIIHPPAQPDIPGQPPQPPPQPQAIPSIQPDPLIENLPVALETAKQWLISDEGQQAKTQNPGGYQNVYAYAKACDQLNKQAQFQQAVVTQAMAGQGPGANLTGDDQIQSPQVKHPPEGSAGNGPSPASASGE